jgi:hypothetical protein
MKKRGKGAEYGRGRKEVPETVLKRVDVREKEEGKAMWCGRFNGVHSLEKRELDLGQKGCGVVLEGEKNTGKGGAMDDPFSASPTRRTPVESQGRGWLKKARFTSRSLRDDHTEDSGEAQMSPSKRPRSAESGRRSALPRAELKQDYDSADLGVVPQDGRAETEIKMLRRRDSTRATKTPRQNKTTRLKGSKEGEIDLDTEIILDAAEHDSVPGENLATNTVAEQKNEDTVEPAKNPVERILPSLLPEDEMAGRSPPREKSFSEGAHSNPGCMEMEGLQGFSESAPQSVPADEHDDGFHLQKSEEQPPRESNVLQRTMPPPLLSTETSTTTVVSVLPSAQVAPQAQAPPRNDSFPSTGDKLSEQQHSKPPHDNEAEHDSFQLSTQAAILVAQQQLQNELTTPQALHLPSTLHHRPDSPTTITKIKSKSGITPFSAFNKPNHSKHSTRSSLNTQDLLDVVTPFDLATTAKKILPNNPPNQDSPTAAIKNGLLKQKNEGRKKTKKRASFAPDTASTSGSSQGSIKASLKVTKSQISNRAEGKEEQVLDSARVPDSAPSLFGKLGLDMETSFEEDEDGNHNQREEEEKEEAPRPSGNPVSSNAAVASASHPPSAAVSSKIPSTAQQQDAQRVPNRPVLTPSTILQQRNSREKAKGESLGFLPDGEGFTAAAPAGEEAFDLSAAMDEVGGFLQSWDVESEIREIRHSCSEGKQGGGAGGGSVSRRSRRGGLKGRAG